MPGMLRSMIMTPMARSSSRAFQARFPSIAVTTWWLVRPLADPLVAVRGVSGSADLGYGRPTLVLDLMALVARLPRGAVAEAEARA